MSCRWPCTGIAWTTPCVGPEFTEWDSFYVIVGSAAGGLIGLQFVVMTLLADRPPQRAEEAAPAFATPTIVHFGTVLFLAAILRAPWSAEFEDWLFHGVLPLTAYAALAITALTATSHARDALFGVGAAALLLLFSGIHNAWDAVAYHVLVNLRSGND